MVDQFVVYIVLGASIVGVELVRKKRIPYDGLLLFNASYFIYFVIAPIHILVGGEDFLRQSLTYQKFGTGGLDVAFWLLASYFLVLLGYASVPGFRSPMSDLFVSRRTWLWSGWVSLMVGIMALLVYSHSVGGIENAVRYSSFIRQGVYEVGGGLLFAKHFIPMLIAGGMIIFVYKYDQYQSAVMRKTKIVLLLFVFLLVIIFVGLVLGGRRVVLFPLIVLFFILSNRQATWNFNYAFILGFAGMVFLGLWDIIGWGIRDLRFAQYAGSRLDSFGSLYTSSFRPISDSFMHWVGMSNSNVTNWMFRDWIMWPAYLVPNSDAVGISVASVTEHTTLLLKETRLSETAGEPPGFHGYLYLNAGILGLIVGSIFFGGVLKFVHIFFFPSRNSANEWLVYIWIVVGCVYFLRHGMIEFVITERFHWWLALVIQLFVALVFRVRIKGNSPIE